MTSQNPFAESQLGNPYASPSSSQLAANQRNPLFVPALILLVIALLWELYILGGLVMVFTPNGPLSSLDDFVRNTVVFSYSLMLIVNTLFIAGAIAMLRLRWRWLAWTGGVIGLIPMFGPCMGLTIPLAVWCIVLLRRPEVSASFSS